MKSKKITYLMFSFFCILAFACVGCTKTTDTGEDNEKLLTSILEKNSLENVSKTNSILTTELKQELKNGKSENGTVTTIYSLESQPHIIKEVSKGASGTMTRLFVVKNDTVDTYFSVDNAKLELNKNTSMNKDGIKALTAKLSLNGDKKDYKIVGTEEENGKTLIKIAYTNKNSAIDTIVESIPSDSELKKNSTFNAAVSRLKKDKTVYYWVDKENLRIVKADSDTTDMSIVFHYLNEGPKDKLPEKTTTSTTISYDNVEKLSVPSEK